MDDSQQETSSKLDHNQQKIKGNIKDIKHEMKDIIEKIDGLQQKYDEVICDEFWQKLSGLTTGKDVEKSQNARGETSEDFLRAPTCYIILCGYGKQNHS